MVRELRSILAEDAVVLNVPATCKRVALETVADHASRLFGVPPGTAFDKLMEREQLGSTAIGRGVALPHGRAPIAQMSGAFFRLKKPVDFDAPDDEGVDLVFLLMAPEVEGAEHLKALSRIARTFRASATRSALRSASTAEAAYAALIGEHDAEAA